uniref:IF rod domain-containing protein n=1 Tax=Monopterus albus TaxID=43700 RepID=A0A3Q3K2L0_MONAL
MPSHIAASMFGGAGGRGSRASVGSLGGLRNALRNEPDRGSASTAHTAHTALATPTAPEDDRQTLRLLNDRLSGYLGKVKQLQEENDNLEKQIDEILTKRKTPEGRDWDAMEKPLDDLKKQVKGITMDNAKLLLQIDNTTLANDDLKKKLGDEKKAGKELEKDLEALKKSIGDTKLNQEQTKKQIGLVKEELDRLQQEHKDEVDVLYEKIQDSEVKVEIDSQDSNLTEILNKIRSQYSNLGKTNLKETEEKYQSKVQLLWMSSTRCSVSYSLLLIISPFLSCFSLPSLTTLRWQRPGTLKSCRLERQSSRICLNRDKLWMLRSTVCTAWYIHKSHFTYITCQSAMKYYRVKSQTQKEQQLSFRSDE